MGISRHHTSRHIIPQTSRRTGVPSIAYFDEPAARGVRAASKAAVTAAVSVMPINERLPNEQYGEADRIVNGWLAVLVDERERLHVGGHAGETELRDGQPEREPGDHHT